MKKMLVIALALGSVLFASSEGAKEKKGFLTTKWCAKQSLFKDCRAESAVCGYGECFKDWNVGDTMKTELVLYVHDERKFYEIDATALNLYEMDEAFYRNDVTIAGDIDANKIIAKGFKAPPPPGKSFFKGCL